ncbi:MAG: hypothetical protein WCC74_00200, partial [Minisyncoccia bacterium]
YTVPPTPGPQKFDFAAKVESGESSHTAYFYQPMNIFMNGACGPAARSYTNTETAYSGAQCNSGSSNNGAFPAPGTTQSWTCSCQGTGCSAPTCSAYKQPVVNGACGPATRTYASTETAYSGAQCNSGSSNNGAFPSPGSSQSWTCSCAGTGCSSPTCTAYKNPINGVCGPAARSYANTETGYSGAQCNSGSSNNGAFPSPGTSQSWTCIGVGSGHSDSGTCTATRSWPGFSASCSASPNLVNIGSQTTWTISLAGGNGSYSGSGSDGVSSWSLPANYSLPSYSVNSTYNSEGTKTFSGTVTSNSQTVPISCTATVNALPPCCGGENPTVSTPVATGLCDGKIQVSWKAVSGMTGYHIFRYLGPNGVDEVLPRMSDVVGTTTKMDSVSANTSYRYKVQGYNSSYSTGISNYSNSATSTDVCPAPITFSCAPYDKNGNRILGSIGINSQITWKIVPGTFEGGSSPYSYVWGGTVGGTNSATTTKYSSIGPKDASLRVSSGSNPSPYYKTTTMDCSPLTVSQYTTANTNCSLTQGGVAKNVVYLNQPVTWSVNTASVPSFSVTNTSWSGDEIPATGLIVSGSSQMSKIYTTVGAKNISGSAVGTGDGNAQYKFDCVATTSVVMPPATTTGQ